MMVVRIVLLSLILLVGVPAGAEEPPYFHLHLSKLQALRERIEREVVLVEARRRASSWPYHSLRYDGAGIHVGKGRILTSAFFLDKVDAIEVRLPGGRKVGARLLRRSLALGLALLEVPAASALPVPPIAPSESFRRPRWVYLLQNPTTPNVQVHQGQLAPAPSGAFYWHTTFVARNGHPLYDEWGRVAGIAALPSKRALTAMVIPAWALREFLAGKDAKPQSSLRIRQVKTTIGRVGLPR